MDLNPMNIVDHAKEIAELIKKYNDIELYQRIVQLQDEIFNLREENRNLKERVKDLETQEDIAAELVRDGNVYVRKHKDGTTSGPYCIPCWDGDRKLVGMYELPQDMVRCGRCDKRTAKE